jgi:hypothetical protein
MGQPTTQSMRQMMRRRVRRVGRRRADRESVGPVGANGGEVEHSVVR